MKSLTIAIPTFNRAKCIKATIDSILNQTYKKFELLIIDNASTDNTEDIVTNIHDKRVRYIKNDENIGYIGNWNKCFELAKGEIVWIVHSDDLLSINAVEIAMDIYDTKNVDCIYGNCKKFIDEKFIPKKESVNFENNVQIYLKGKDAVSFVATHIPFCSATSFKREIYLAIGGFSNNYPYSSDEEFICRIAKTHSIAYADYVMGYYRDHNDHLMAKTWEKDDFFCEYVKLCNCKVEYLIGVNADTKIVATVRAIPKAAIVGVIIPTLILFDNKYLAKKYLNIYKTMDFESIKSILKYIYYYLLYLIPNRIAKFIIKARIG